MSEAPFFEVRFDEAAGILHMRISGFWTKATLAAFGARLLVETGKLRLARRRYDILSDASCFPVQAPDVAAGFETLTRKGAEFDRGRTAIVVGGVLAKKQAERTMATPGLKIFLDEAEARAWLAADRGKA